MSRTTDVSIQEWLRRNPEMNEGGGSISSSDAALNSLLTSIANNSIASQAYGIPMNTGSRGPVDASGLLTMSEAQANQILQQRAAERGIEILPIDSLNPPQFAVGPGFDDQNVFKDPAEIDPADVVGPTEELGIEDSIFQILYDTIIGEQGIPEGVSAEVIDAIKGDFGDAAGAEDLRAIAEQIAEAGGFDQWLEQQDIVLGDPGQIDEDTTQSPVETVFEDDGTITTIIDPTLITLPPLLGDPVIEDTIGGGATASPETEGEPQATEPEPEANQVIPDYSDLVNPEFEVPEAPEGVTGIPEFYRVDEDGNVTVILDPDNPILIPPERVPGHVDTTTPGTYPESGGVTAEQEETTTPTTSGPSIVIAPPPASTPTTTPAASTPSDIVTEEPTGVETPSDTANTGTDATGQEGQQGTDTGGTGAGSAGNGGDNTGDGVDDPKGMFKDKFTPLTYNIGYAPVQLQQQIQPQQTNAMDQITRLIGRQTGMLV